MRVIILPNQTLSDIAIQEYGAIEAVFLLAQANDISPTAALITGASLECPERVYNRSVQEYCKKNGVSPATSEMIDSEIRLRIFTEQFQEQFI